MRTVRLTIAYDGTEFEGWQLQRPEQRTVQGAIETALTKLSGLPLRPTAAGRTDAGVHALGQVLSVALPDGVDLPPKAFVYGVNRALPGDVAVLAAAEATPGFDARRDSRGKHYRYQLYNRNTRHPLLRHTHWVVFEKLCADAMREAAAHFVGLHDFAAFRAADCQSRTSVRRLHKVGVEAGPDGELNIDVEGTAFLKHMVRTLVGTLVDVGAGRRRPTDMPRLLTDRDRTRAGRTAPAHGLTLMRVRYEEGPVTPAG